MFLSVAALSVLRLRRSTLISFDTATIISWVFVLTGVMYYVYLTYTELFVLEAICQWCVASSVVTLLILILESVQLWSVLDLGGGDDGYVDPARPTASRR